MGKNKKHLRGLRRWIARIAVAIVVLLIAVWAAAPVLAPSLEKRTRLPSVVYSRPTTLSPGIRLTRNHVGTLLDRRGYRKVGSASTVREGEYAGTNPLTVGRREFFRGDRRVLFDVLTLEFDEETQLEKITNGRNVEVPRDELEPEILGRLYGSYWHDRLPVTLDEVPKHLVQAVIEIEDRRFYKHAGIDPRRVIGAIVANKKAGAREQGGSTITQQLVKNVFLTSERTYWRKIKEAVLAVLIDRKYDKDTILTAYLNEVYLGQRGPVSIHGVGQAAHHYFGKQADELTRAEAAFLVGLIQAPGRHSPYHSLKGATERRDLVLKVLLERERIDKEQHRRATQEALRVRAPSPFEQAAPFVTAHVRSSLASEYDAEALATEGLQIHTTIDARLQRIANRAVARRLTSLEKTVPRLKKNKTPIQAAVVVLTPHAGDVLALVGGRDFKSSQFNRAIQSQRQPGSAFKPIVALAALGSKDFTLATRLKDEKFTVKTSHGPWTPVNYDKQYRGDVTLRHALESSLNVPIARMAAEIGIDTVIDTARDVGIASTLDPVPSLALGSSEVTLLELTQAYAVLASGGLYTKPTDIHAVLTSEGELIRYHGRETRRAVGEAEAFLVTSALQGVVDRGTGRTLRRLGYEGTVAGKTGTTNDSRDAWFVGYTPDIVIGVWVGFDEGSPTGLSGSSAAVPIFHDVLVGALGSDYDREFFVPDDIERIEIHADTGLRAGFGCRGEDEYFIEGTAPEKRCEAEEWQPVRKVADWFSGLFKRKKKD